MKSAESGTKGDNFRALCMNLNPEEIIRGGRHRQSDIVYVLQLLDERNVNGKTMRVTGDNVRQDERRKMNKMRPHPTYTLAANYIQNNIHTHNDDDESTATIEHGTS